MPIYKTYTLEAGQLVSETLPIFNLYQVDGTADWFTPVIGFLGNLTGYSIVAPAIGSYSVTFTQFQETGNITWTIVLNVVVDTLTLYNNCCGDRNIAWYNIQGGWQNYIFTGIKEFRVEVGNSKQFKTNEYVSKHSQIEGVFDGEVISSGDIPRSHVDALQGLKYAIQVFLYNTDTEAWDIPILIDIGSFPKYKSTDKFFDFRVKFIYATEILVQTQ